MLIYVHEIHYRDNIMINTSRTSVLLVCIFLAPFGAKNFTGPGQVPHSSACRKLRGDHWTKSMRFSGLPVCWHEGGSSGNW